jgi:quercetin dioxygenase-like cupin family protein
VVGRNKENHYPDTGRKNGYSHEAFMTTPIVLWFTALCLQSPADRVEPIIDNQRVAVWDLTWTAAKTQPVHHGHDFITVHVTGGIFETTLPDGTSKTAAMKIGDVEFEAKGTTHRVHKAKGGNPRTIEIELKDYSVTPLANTSGLPNAFPRDGVKKLLENGRVTIWDVTWLPGKPTPMHFHGFDAIAVYLESGALKATTPDGQSVVNEYVPGFTKFNPRNRIHSEALAKGTEERAIVVDLK